MKRCLAVTLVLAIVLVAPQAWATGTPAGTDIMTQATATFTIGSTEMTVPSNLVTVQVVELLSVSTVWQDAANITVAPGDSNSVLTFLVTNTGNGTDTYTLTGLSDGVPGDQFDPALVDLYLDSNGDGVFNMFVDDQYVPGVNDPDLVANASVIVYVVNNIPLEFPAGSPLADGDLGHSQLMATPATPAPAPRAPCSAGAGDDGTDAVVGESGGNDTATSVSTSSPTSWSPCPSRR